MLREGGKGTLGLRFFVAFEIGGELSEDLFLRGHRKGVAEILLKVTKEWRVKRTDKQAFYMDLIKTVCVPLLVVIGNRVSKKP